MFKPNLTEEIRLREQSEIITALKDRIAKDPEGTATAMMTAAIAVMAKVYPAQLDNSTKTKIKDNYPSATAALMAERSMSRDGVLLTAQRGLTCALIALDYSPLSHDKPQADSDTRLPGQISNLREKCSEVFAAGVASGLSPLGVSAIMATTAAERASDHGVSRFTMLKTLAHLSLVLIDQEVDSLVDGTEKSRREAMVKALALAILSNQTKH